MTDNRKSDLVRETIPILIRDVPLKDLLAVGRFLMGTDEFCSYEICLAWDQRRPELEAFEDGYRFGRLVLGNLEQKKVKAELEVAQSVAL